MKLVLTDASARRQRERKVYNRVAEALEREARRLRRFAEDDKPAFERWVDAEFERELTLLREIERRVGELRGLISDVRRYAELTGTSERRAFELLTAAKAAGREEALWQDALGVLSDEERDEEYEREHEHEHEHEHEPPGRDWKRDEVEGKTGRGGAVTEYLKGLYRKLVRILHPDVQPDGGQATQKLWHEVQAAYEWADVQTLERLYRSVVKDEGEKRPEFSLDTCPIGEIIALRQDMERRLETLRREAAEQRRHPAWDFAATRRNERRLRRLAEQVAADLASDTAQTRRVADMLDKVVARWQKDQTRADRPRRRARR
jgi:hypothetical protein